MKEPLTAEQLAAVPVLDGGKQFPKFYVRRDDGIVFYHDAEGTWTVYDDDGKLLRVRVLL